MLHFLNSNHDQATCGAPVWEGSLTVPLGIPSGTFWRQREQYYLWEFVLVLLHLFETGTLCIVCIVWLWTELPNANAVDCCLECPEESLITASFCLFIFLNGTADASGYFCYFFSPISDTSNGWGTFQHYSFVLDYPIWQLVKLKSKTHLPFKEKKSYSLMIWQSFNIYSKCNNIYWLAYLL